MKNRCGSLYQPVLIDSCFYFILLLIIYDDDRLEGKNILIPVHLSKWDHDMFDKM